MGPRHGDQTRNPRGQPGYARVGKNELYAVYEAWCRDSGEFPVSKKKLGQQLIERGFAEGRSRTGRYWIGIGVIDEGASYGQG